eukprot:1629694-Amphidinium_carterae.2
MAVIHQPHHANPPITSCTQFGGPRILASESSTLAPINLPMLMSKQHNYISVYKPLALCHNCRENKTRL